MSGNNLGPLGEAGVKGAFYEGLEIGDGWAMSAGVLIPSDSLVESHRWMGQVPQLREHAGSTIAQAMRARGLSVTNKDYDAAMYLYRDDIRRDKTGQMLQKVGEFGEKLADHWQKIGVEELEGTTLGWDGVVLFSAAHVDGKGGTQSNIWTSSEIPALDVTTATAPTKAECIDIMLGIATKFYGLLDDQGDPTNARARLFKIVAPEGLFPAFAGAAADALNASGGTSELANQRFRFEVEMEPRLASGAVVFAYVADQRSKGLILQDEVSPEIELDYGEWVSKRRVLVKAYASRRVAPGDWRKIGKATLS